MFTVLVLPHQPRGGSTSLWPSLQGVLGTTDAAPAAEPGGARETFQEAFWAALKIQREAWPS